MIFKLHFMYFYRGFFLSTLGPKGPRSSPPWVGTCFCETKYLRCYVKYNVYSERKLCNIQLCIKSYVLFSYARLYLFCRFGNALLIWQRYVVMATVCRSDKNLPFWIWSVISVRNNNPTHLKLHVFQMICRESW